MKTGLPDWEALTDRVYQGTVKTINKFAQEHPEEICSFLAFLAPMSISNIGFVILLIDTVQNSLKMAQEAEVKTLAWQKSLKNSGPNGEWDWESAAEYSQYARIITPYNSDILTFKYQAYGQVFLEELINFEEENIPQKSFHFFNDYVGGNMQILLCEVVNRIIENDDLRPLNLASPFYLGSQLPDDEPFPYELAILRILNWPTISATAVSC